MELRQSRRRSRSRGVAVMPVGYPNSTSVSLFQLNLTNGQVLATPYVRDAFDEQYLIPESGEYFVFHNSSAFSINIATRETTTYNNWANPSQCITSTSTISILGYDVARSVFYMWCLGADPQSSHLGNVGPETFLFFASEDKNHWAEQPLTYWTIPAGWRRRPSPGATMSQDASAIIIVVDSQHAPPNNLLFAVYNLTTSRWSAPVNVTTGRYWVNANSIAGLSKSNDQLLIWGWHGPVTKIAATFLLSTGAELSAITTQFDDAWQDTPLVTIPKTNQLLYVGCPPGNIAPSNPTSFNISFWDVNEGGIAYQWSIPILSVAAPFARWCEYTWSSIGC